MKKINDFRTEARRVLPMLLRAGYRDGVYEDYRELSALRLGKLSEMAKSVFDAWSAGSGDLEKLEELDDDIVLRNLDEETRLWSASVAIMLMIFLEDVSVADGDVLDDLAEQDLGWLARAAQAALDERFEMELAIASQRRSGRNDMH